MIKLQQDQEVTIINEQGNKESGYKVFNPKENDGGLVSLIKNGTIVNISPKRVCVKTAETPTETTPETTPEATQTKIKPKTNIVKPKQAAPQKIDLAALCQYGELWIKNVDFDGKTDAKALCLLFPTKNRYLSFNTYNGTLGKNGKSLPIKELLDGDEKIGHTTGDIDKHREKLKKNRYTLYNP